MNCILYAVIYISAFIFCQVKRLCLVLQNFCIHREFEGSVFFQCVPWQKYLYLVHQTPHNSKDMAKWSLQGYKGPWASHYKSLLINPLLDLAYITPEFMVIGGLVWLLTSWTSKVCKFWPRRHVFRTIVYNEIFPAQPSPVHASSGWYPPSQPAPIFQQPQPSILWLSEALSWTHKLMDCIENASRQVIHKELSGIDFPFVCSQTQGPYSGAQSIPLIP